jgi:hypothetical protein
MLDAAKREVTLQKWVVLQATRVEEGACNAEEMASFSAQVYTIYSIAGKPNRVVLSKRRPSGTVSVFQTIVAMCRRLE